jgi:2-dehydro-3-deoxyphosphogluconate aldolase/(4S)-4-hydroxy-2-oxoglutarate aldolase
MAAFDYTPILARRIISVITIDRVEDAEPLAGALVEGGIDSLEITFRTTAAAEAICRIRAAFPQIHLGAGTLLTGEQVAQAAHSGATFGLAPGLNPVIVRAAHERGLGFIPGVMTPSDVESALSLGCLVQKFFPAEVAGGIGMLKALSAPYANTGVRFIPLGGVTAASLKDYLDTPCVAAVGGSWIADRNLIKTKDWAGIKRLAREAVSIAKQG